MVRSRKLLQLAVILVVAGYVAWTEYAPRTPAGTGAADDSALVSAIANRESDVQVTGTGEVIKLLGDDTRGSRHQRFLVRIDSGDVILVAHNIDLAPRLDALREGDTIAFNGEFEWNDKGGVVHWTHRDPRGHHVDGWLRHDGNTYW